MFLSTFLHEITLKAIDIDNIRCLEPFLILWDHFEIRRFLGLKCKLDLTLRHMISQHLERISETRLEMILDSSSGPTSSGLG